MGGSKIYPVLENIEDYYRYTHDEATVIDLSSWDTSSVRNVGGFCNKCTALETLNISNWKCQI